MTRRYERSYLLSDAKRNDVLTLDEVLRYGRDSFDDPQYVSLYGRRPAEWYALGVRLRGRTAVECTRDALADRIGRETAAVAQTAPDGSQPVIVDPFAGSANTLFWLAHHVDARRALGFELDAWVFETTSRNLALVGFDADVRRLPYDAALVNLQLTSDELLTSSSHHRGAMRSTRSTASTYGARSRRSGRSSTCLPAPSRTTRSWWRCRCMSR